MRDDTSNATLRIIHITGISRNKMHVYMKY